MILRAACHVHSTWSYDGSWTINELSQLFKGRGYDVVLLTEHDRGWSEEKRLRHRNECRTVSSDGFLVISGIEYSESTNTNHVLTWGDVPFAGENVPTVDLLRHVKIHEGICVFAHPARKNAWKNFLPEWKDLLDGVEVWNRKSDGWAPSESGIEIANEYGLPGYVGLDFHTRKQLCPITLRIDVDGGLTEENVLLAMQQRCVTGIAFTVTSDTFLRPVFRSVAVVPEKIRSIGAFLLKCTQRSVSQFK